MHVVTDPTRREDEKRREGTGHPRRLVLEAPAKVNLVLSVGAVRADGYHEVLTVMQTVDLCDLVEVSPSERLSVRCEPSLGIDEREDLTYRAASLLAEATGRRPAVDIRVIKRVPHGAGLGGGSSDAAAVLVALSRLWDIDPLGAEVRSTAARLGADVAFFLSGGTMIMSGRGERVVGRLCDPRAGIVIARPPCAVSTAEAYREFDRTRPGDDRADVHELGEALDLRTAECPSGRAGVPAGAPAGIRREGSLARVAAAMSNSLSDAAVSLCPEVGDALFEVGEAPGVVRAMVSGSGSAVFGLCEDVATAGAAARHVAERTGWWTHAGSTRPRGVSFVDVAVDGDACGGDAALR